MRKEIRIVQCDNYYYIQERKMFCRWKDLWDGSGYCSSLKKFKDFEGGLIVDWYVTDYLKTNKRHVTVLVSFVKSFKA